MTTKNALGYKSNGISLSTINDKGLKLFTDGGVILSNPSPYGGTWAYIAVMDNYKVFEESGYITGKGLVTNNQMELYAVIQALQYLMSDETVTILSDSEVTLGRVFGHYVMNNIPACLIADMEEQKERLTKFKQIKHVLLAGHPTKKQLASGVGRNGHPVSIWNVRCDELCKQQAEKYVSTYLKP